MSNFRPNFSFYRFCKNWRGGANFLFLVLPFNVTSRGSWVILITAGPFAHITYSNKIYSRFFTRMFFLKGHVQNIMFKISKVFKTSFKFFFCVYGYYSYDDNFSQDDEQC